MSSKRRRKASSMSRWVRGIYNAAANFNMSNALRAASGKLMDRDSEHLHKVDVKPDQRNKPNQPCQSDKCTCDPGSNATCTCAGATTGRHTSFPCAHCRDHDAVNDLILSASIRSTDAYSIESIERDYADYIAATSAERQGVGTRVRDSIESRHFKQANANSTDSIERRTGIPAGVAI